MFVLPTNKKWFQAACSTGSLGPYDVLIRTIPGHIGKAAMQIRPEQAHARVHLNTDISLLAHHTKTELLERIIGVDAPGFLLG